jgi:perosamine synthetase
VAAGTASGMIPYGRQYIDDDDIRAVVEVLRSGLLTQGPAVEAFEQAVRDYVGAKYAVAVSSCTAALHLAALAAGVRRERQVITSPITFVASANAAYYAGGSAAFADIEPDTINMSAGSLARALECAKDPAAVVPVHFAGLPCKMDAIGDVADAAGVPIIEDAAHALGAVYEDGVRVGACPRSLMTVFSFHPVKLIAAGEGGMITTNDESIYRHLLRLRSHGINKLDDPLRCPEAAYEGDEPNPWYYEMQEIGFHYRITDIQSALGRSQLAKIDRFIERRRQLVAAYDEALAGLDACRPAQVSGRDRSGHHLYVLRIEFARAGLTRGALMRALRSRGIVTQVHYIPVQAHPFYRDQGFSLDDCPAAVSYYEEALSIPLFYDLSDDQQLHIVTCLRDLLQ